MDRGAGYDSGDRSDAVRRDRVVEFDRATWRAAARLESPLGPERGERAGGSGDDSTGVTPCSAWLAAYAMGLSAAGRCLGEAATELVVAAGRDTGLLCRAEDLVDEVGVGGAELRGVARRFLEAARQRCARELEAREHPR